MKRFFIVLIFLFTWVQLHAGLFDTLSIGFSGGYTSYNTISGAFYLKSTVNMFNRRTEIKAGLNTRSYKIRN